MPQTGYRGSLADRLAAKTDKGDGAGCWNWIGTVYHVGYGAIWRDRRMVYAHRAAYELAHGAIPDGKYVLHHCDNRLCVRPDHLFLGTHRDNADDMRAKQRHARGEMFPQAKLNHDAVRDIRARAKAGEPQAAIARDHRVNQSSVSKVVAGKRWRHVEGFQCR